MKLRLTSGRQVTLRFGAPLVGYRVRSFEFDQDDIIAMRRFPLGELGAYLDSMALKFAPKDRDYG